MKKTLAAIIWGTGILLIILVLLAGLRVERSPVENLEEVTLRLSFEGEFEIKQLRGETPKIAWAAVKSLNYPEASEYLEIIDFGASEPYTISKDAFGNSVVTLNFSEPKIGINAYRLWTTVKTKKIIVNEIPDSLERIPDEFRYENDMIQSKNPEIVAKAEAVTQNSLTQYEKVRDVSEWVFDNIKYDLAVENETLDALWTLQNKKGVCVEMSHLAEAMLRSLFIPARHVYGAAPYNFPYGWQEHTWVEAYVGKWIPVDPTWDETEYLDPAHVTFARVPDQTDVEEKVSVSGRGIEMGYMILPAMSVEIIDEKRGEEPIYFELFGKKIKLR